jgi:hypothetical protein
MVARSSPATRKPTIGVAISWEHVGMPIRIECINIDALDPMAQARWWATALGWVVTDADDDEVVIRPAAGSSDTTTVPEILFAKVPETKVVKNRVHLDLRPDDQAAEVARFEALGARRVDVGQSDEVTWVVLADLEDNEFCILRAAQADPLTS